MVLNRHVLGVTTPSPRRTSPPPSPLPSVAARARAQLPLVVPLAIFFIESCLSYSSCSSMRIFMAPRTLRHLALVSLRTSRAAMLATSSVSQSATLVQNEARRGAFLTSSMFFMT